MDSLRYDLGTAEVYVFTPKGDVMALPAGATPVDFAYSVHTEIGHRCVGARVNGKLVPLESELSSGDVVEIFTSRPKVPGPVATGLVSSHPREPKPRSRRGSPRSAAKKRSTTAKIRSHERCARRASRYKD